MTAAVDRLEKRGLVVRRSTPGDRRARIVELTKQGERVAAEYFEKHARDLEDLMSVLSDREKQQVYSSLRKLGLLAVRKLIKARQAAQDANIKLRTSDAPAEHTPWRLTRSSENGNRCRQLRGGHL